MVLSSVQTIFDIQGVWEVESTPIFWSSDVMLMVSF